MRHLLLALAVSSGLGGCASKLNEEEATAVASRLGPLSRAIACAAYSEVHPNSAEPLDDFDPSWVRCQGGYETAEVAGTEEGTVTASDLRVGLVGQAESALEGSWSHDGDVWELDLELSFHESLVEGRAYTAPQDQTFWVSFEGTLVVVATHPENQPYRIEATLEGLGRASGDVSGKGDVRIVGTEYSYGQATGNNCTGVTWDAEGTVAEVPYTGHDLLCFTLPID